MISVNVKLPLSYAKVYKMDIYALITFKDLTPTYFQEERACMTSHTQ